MKLLKCLSLLYLGLLLLYSCKKEDISTPENSTYYWSDQRKIVLSRDKNNFVAIIDQNELSSLTNLLKEKGININHHADNYYILKTSNIQISNEILKNQGIFSTLNIAPTYTAYDRLIIPTDTILLTLKEGINIGQIREILGNQILSIQEKKYGKIVIKIKNTKEVFDLANKIYEKGLVEWCMPNLYIPFTNEI
jgi:hypothetical protein